MKHPGRGSNSFLCLRFVQKKIQEGICTMTDDVRYKAVADNIARILDEVGEEKVKYRSPDDTVRLMAVTKTVDPDVVNSAIRSGIDLLGENRVQEYLSKKESYLKGAEVHFIGGLQLNKVKYIVGDVSMIHSVDSLRLGNEIDRLAKAKGIVQDVLVEVNIGDEATKHGVSEEALPELIAGLSEFGGICVRGLMTIPPPGTSEKNFERMQRLFYDYRSVYPAFDTLSMGMSADYRLAVRFGSTIIRVGSGIFGAREYKK